MSNKVGGVHDVFVKGGTTTSAWDNAKRRQYEQSKANRAHQDRQRRAVARAASSPNEAAMMASHELGSRRNPMVCLKYKARDSVNDRDAICEIISQPHENDPSQVGLVLILVCPKCLERTGQMDDSQVMIKSWHRHFELDTSRAAIRLDPLDGSETRLAGVINLKDLCSCDARGCDWKFRIDNSVLFGSDQYNL